MSQRGLSDPPRRTNSQAGFGLTETVLSLTLFAVAMTGIAGTAARVGAGLNGAYIRTQALTVAQAQIESLLATPYDQMESGTAEEQGVTMRWEVSERDGVKEIALVYRRATPNGAVVRALTAARLEP
jgi:Tfp pilus assembly protein PilV